MNHKKIKKLLLSFIDGDLNETDSEAVRSHISSCKECRSSVNILNKAWVNKPSKKVAPSFQWIKIKNKIVSGNKDISRLYGFIPQFRPVLRFLAYSILIIFAVFLGNNIGNTTVFESNSSEPKRIKSQVRSEFYLDRFNPIPPESIGNLALFSELRSGEEK
jgi:hypothetical protein